jgi:hypothetical protein
MNGTGWCSVGTRLEMNPVPCGGMRPAFRQRTGRDSCLLDGRSLPAMCRRFDTNLFLGGLAALLS